MNEGLEKKLIGIELDLESPRKDHFRGDVEFREVRGFIGLLVKNGVFIMRFWIFQVIIYNGISSVLLEGRGFYFGSWENLEEEENEVSQEESPLH